MSPSLHVYGLTYECDISHTWMRRMTHTNVWHDSFISLTCLIHMCDMTHSYLWHASFICVTWLIHISDMPDSYVWHDSFISLTCLIHMCDMTHLYLSHTNESHDTMRDVSHIWMRLTTHTNETYHTHESVIPAEREGEAFASMGHDAYEWGIWHIQMWHITHMNAWYQQREKVKPSLQWDMTHTNEGCDTCKFDTSHR